VGGDRWRNWDLRILWRSAADRWCRYLAGTVRYFTSEDPEGCELAFNSHLPSLGEPGAILDEYRLPGVEHGAFAGRYSQNHQALDCLLVVLYLGDAIENLLGFARKR
jgi:hypothetical protein